MFTLTVADVKVGIFTTGSAGDAEAGTGVPWATKFHGYGSMQFSKEYMSFLAFPTKEEYQGIHRCHWTDLWTTMRKLLVLCDTPYYIAWALQR